MVARGLFASRLGISSRVKRKLVVGLLLIALGLAAIVVSALAEFIGIASSEKGARAVFGWKQIVGVAVGLVVLVAGVIIARRATRGSNGATRSSQDAL